MVSVFEHILLIVKIVLVILVRYINSSAHQAIINDGINEIRSSKENEIRTNVRLHALETLVLNRLANYDTELLGEVDSILGENDRNYLSLKHLCDYDGDAATKELSGGEGNSNKSDQLAINPADRRKTLFQTIFDNTYPTTTALLTQLFPIEMNQSVNFQSGKLYSSSNSSNDVSTSFNPVNTRPRTFSSTAMMSAHEYDSFLERETSWIPKRINFGINPTVILPVIFLPIVLHLFSISIYFYIPLSCFFLLYLQTVKDLKDAHYASRIVSSDVELSGIMKFIQPNSKHPNFLPQVLNDSSFQQVEWVNTIMKRLWQPWMSNAFEDKVRKKWLELSVKYHFDKSLTLETVSLGDICPKLLGVRILDSNEDIIRMDWDVRYNGDPDIIFKVKQTNTNLGISDMIILAKVRMELSHFNSKIPCIGGVYISFLELPYIDFSFTIAGIDIMKIGMKSMLISAIRQECLFPNRVFIAMDHDTKEDDATVPIPKGIVHIIIEKAENLDLTESANQHPFIEIQHLDQKYQSQKKSSNSPLFNESFDILTYDATSVAIELIVYNFDGSPHFIGKTCLDIITNSVPIQPWEVIKYEKKLEDVVSGVVFVTCCFIPLQCATFVSHKNENSSVVSDAFSNKSSVDSKHYDTQYSDILLHLTQNQKDVFQNDVLPSAHDIIKASSQLNKIRKFFNKKFTKKKNVELLSLSNQLSNHNIGVLTVSNININHLDSISATPKLSSNSNSNNIYVGKPLLRPYVCFEINESSSTSDPTFVSNDTIVKSTAKLKNTLNKNYLSFTELMHFIVKLPVDDGEDGVKLADNLFLKIKLMDSSDHRLHFTNNHDKCVCEKLLSLNDLIAVICSTDYSSSNNESLYSSSSNDTPILSLKQQKTSSLKRTVRVNQTTVDVQYQFVDYLDVSVAFKASWSYSNKLPE